MTGSQIGRPRKDSVPREMRTCIHHGREEFARYSGAGWRCMKCHREREAIRDLLKGTRVKNDTEEGRIREERRGVPCSSCGIEMPLTGRCDDCD